MCYNNEVLGIISSCMKIHIYLGIDDIAIGRYTQNMSDTINIVFVYIGR